MIFAPYRNVLDLAHHVNGSDDRQRPQLAWDEIDYELAGSVIARLKVLASNVPSLASRHLTPVQRQGKQRNPAIATNSPSSATAKR